MPRAQRQQPLQWLSDDLGRAIPENLLGAVVEEDHQLVLVGTDDRVDGNLEGLEENGAVERCRHECRNMQRAAPGYE